MRIWLLSDLHQEFMRDPTAAATPHTRFDPAIHAPADGFDVVVLAGDVDVPLTSSLRWIADRFAGVPVVAVAGNHDFYSDPDAPFTMTEMRRRGVDLAGELGIHLLDDSATVIDGVRFAGGTLWTDFSSIGYGDVRAKIAEAAGRFGMNDYRRIKRQSSLHPGKRKRLSPEDTIAAHRDTRAFLESELARSHDGATVVVTHHAPLPQSLDDRHRGRLDWCYASDLSLLIDESQPDLWLHGHIHRAVDYTIGGTRIVSNPRGYAFDASERNHGFDAGRVIEIDVPAPRPPSA
ncbi:MAG: metallophosphoesterase [Devosia sp.]|uniref:metallophosphoesterase n=1 Tax=Devosia sp. TaxID=1871048 RepID=UPI0024CDB66D|nr:metallophosphoesterase [Devosia sp.]UYO00234.1 MAG: metallophosphoesterase [Devosia sp.]